MANKPLVKFAFPTLVFFVLLFVCERDVLLFLPFAAALLHELGHLLVMIICRQRIKQITVFPFGVDIKKVPFISSYKTDIAVSSAGIAVNISMTVLCCFLPNSSAVDIFQQSNALLFAINVLPIKTLDGGQILEKVLLLLLPPDTVDKIMGFCSFVCIIIVGSVAVWVLFYSGYNFSLLFMCMYLFAGVFLKK